MSLIFNVLELFKLPRFSKIVNLSLLTSLCFTDSCKIQNIAGAALYFDPERAANTVVAYNDEGIYKFKTVAYLFRLIRQLFLF